jgi:hypothetical protein
MAGRARTSHHELTARLYRERASNRESNSKILRDFLLRVNLEESGSYAEHGVSESITGSSENSTDEHPATLTGSILASRQPASMRRILPTSAANGDAFHGSPE